MALDFTSFHAMSLLNQGPLSCLTGTALPPTAGVTFSILDSSGYASAADQIANNVSGNGFPIRNGHILTLYGDGSTQLLIGYDNTTISRTGLHASAFIRNRGMDGAAQWSDWSEILDSQNFTTYIATSQAANAAQGTWNIDISGRAEVARYLLPVVSNQATHPVYGAFVQSQNILSTYGVTSNNVLIWGEQFKDTSWTYTNGSITTTYTSEGFIGFFLEPSQNNDSIKLNMLINGTYYGNFQGSLQGNATSATNANISTITNTLAYYNNNIGTFSYTGNITYMPNIQAELPYQTVNETSTYGNVTGLHIRGRSFISPDRNRLLFGDAGPQIRFTDTEDASSTKTGAIIFTRDGTLSGAGPSFSFVNGYSSNNQTISERNTVIITDGIIAHTQLGIGVEQLNQNYALEVQGDSYYVGELRLGSSANATIGSIRYPYDSRQHTIWANDNSVISGINLSTYGTGLYRTGQNLIYAIANATGINLFTNSNIALLHNSMVIPNTGNATGVVGSGVQPVYINQGVITPTTYELNTNVIASATANRFAYYKLNTVQAEDSQGNMQVISSNIDIDYTTTHFISDNNVSFGSTSTIQNYFMYINGNTLFNGLVSFQGNAIPSATTTYNLGASGDGNHWKALFIGANDSYGTTEQPIYWNNGVPTATTYGLKATVNNGTGTRIAYYSADREISSGTIHTNGVYLSNVTNLTVGNDHQTDYMFKVTGNSFFHGTTTHNGSILLSSNGAGSLGQSGIRWTSVYIGSADSYGDAYTPIYWNSGVPTAVTIVQKVPWKLNSGNKSCKIDHSSMFTAGSIVTQIVVTSGEIYLGAPLTWKSAAGYIVINTSVAATGTITGYAIVTRGSEYGESSFTYTNANAEV